MKKIIAIILQQILKVDHFCKHFSISFLGKISNPIQNEGVYFISNAFEKNICPAQGL